MGKITVEQGDITTYDVDAVVNIGIGAHVDVDIDADINIDIDIAASWSL